MNKFLKENWFKLGVLIVVTIIGFSIAYYHFYSLPKMNSEVQSPKEDLELQAMCSKKANEFFGDSISSRTYTVHYNHKLKKCFGLTEEYLHGDGFENFTMNLWDVYEGKAYAGWQSYVGKTPSENDFHGDVAGRSCKDQFEFRSLIKPYMEE